MKQDAAILLALATALASNGADVKYYAAKLVSGESLDSYQATQFREALARLAETLRDAEGTQVQFLSLGLGVGA